MGPRLEWEPSRHEADLVRRLVVMGAPSAERLPTVKQQRLGGSILPITGTIHSATRPINGEAHQRVSCASNLET